MTPLVAFGSTGLSTHRFGFGCYRVVEGNETHRKALESYLDRGGNLIDTSANYGDGQSEELVGSVLAGRNRAEIVLVTKGGYIQGQNMALARERRFPETVEYNQQVWHSIHPEFLETQVERSLARLRQDSVDVFLLHNPEYFLEAAAHHQTVGAQDHDEFYRRVREAFRYLETQVDAGRIRWYGVSSNNFNQAAFSPEAPTMTSVSRCLNEARAVREDHHFRVVQLPLNLYEAGGALTPNNNNLTVLDFCREQGLAVLANRPLNAFHENRLIRLADFGVPGGGAASPEVLRAELRPLAEAEERFAEWSGEQVQLASAETVSETIFRVASQAQSAGHWEQSIGRHVIEPTQAWLVDVSERFGRRDEWAGWRFEFVGRINGSLEQVQRFLGARQQPQSDEVRARLRAAGYPDSEESLSQMTLRLVAGLQGMCGALVGMRTQRYVDDVMGVFETGPSLTAEDCLEILRLFNSPNN